ncbi:hypothetical protein DK45_2707 [Bordetella bronchiseptica]|nr:hypothetical protein DK45_2707 [Bordetella bronchiseptica]
MPHCLCCAGTAVDSPRQCGFSWGAQHAWRAEDFRKNVQEAGCRRFLHWLPGTHEAFPQNDREQACLEILRRTNPGGARCWRWQAPP